MNKITDIFGKTPNVGDIIVFNPPHYKSLVYGECKALNKAGNPRVEITSDYKGFRLDDEDGLYAPRTKFVIVNNNNNE